jgi:hypothetical protein
MKLIEEKVDDGVLARRFDLQVGEETVPGMHWLPAAVEGSATSHARSSSTSRAQRSNPVQRDGA